MIPAAILSATTLLSTADTLDGVTAPAGSDAPAVEQRTPWVKWSGGDASPVSGIAPAGSGASDTTPPADPRRDPKLATLVTTADATVPGSTDDKGRAVLIAVVALLVVAWMWLHHG